MNVNFENDALFLELYNNGSFSITDDGWVLNHKTGRKIGYTTNKGYRAFGWKIQGKSRSILLHRLVYLINGGKFTFDRPIINHKSGFKDHNDFSNLEACSYKENYDHAITNGLTTKEWTDARKEKVRTQVSGDKHIFSKMDGDLREEIKQKHGEGKSCRELAKEYGIHHTNIAKMIRGFSYKQCVAQPV